MDVELVRSEGEEQGREETIMSEAEETKLLHEEIARLRKENEGLRREKETFFPGQERVSNIAYNVVNGICTPISDQSAPVYITFGDGGNLEGQPIPQCYSLRVDTTACCRTTENLQELLRCPGYGARE
ncbi:hypothetical protein IFM89_034908 [Coptis chinensis]|uniref:Uncharacterized protein n=1 Tax=Coptis chinensis TaxID=261450 RepID=A0A835LY04_9MAGN|nr:hypothetical protein IFM89_034908 [Coptis chinensis]